MARTCSVLVAGIALVVACNQAYAQAAAEPPATAVAAPAPAINYRERPRAPYDPQRLKLKPTLDGQIGENEWTPLYTVTDGPVKGTVYVNWDDDYLYVAARTDTPCWFAFDLDANGDGWLRGADNLELVIGPPDASANPQVTARILDAASTRDVPAWNLKVVDPKSIQVVVKSGASGQVVEMAIPKGVAGLNPRKNAGMACRGDFVPMGPPPAPTAPYEPHLLLDITLVEAKGVGAGGVAPRLVLEDNRLIAGQTFAATLDLMNQVEEDRQIKSVTWQGEGAAADLLSTLREVTIPPLKGLKSLRLKYKSVLPPTAIPGFYQMSVVAQLDNGSSVSANASFSVVEALSADLVLEPQSVTLIGPTQIKGIVEITNAFKGYMRGSIDLVLPSGWTVKGKTQRTYNIPRQDGMTREVFAITIPSTTPAGDYAVNGTVTWRGKSWKIHRTIRVDRQPEPVKPPQG